MCKKMKEFLNKIALVVVSFKFDEDVLQYIETISTQWNDTIVLQV